MKWVGLGMSVLLILLILWGGTRGRTPKRR
jgi:hypothetical protein